MIKLQHAILGSIIPMIIITCYANNTIDSLYDKIEIINGQVYNKMYTTFDVTVTTYHPTKEQTDSTPNELADGTKINPKKASLYRYVALSRDLLSRWGGPFNYGDYIIIKGAGENSGVYQVRDTMNSKWTNRVDILTTNSKFKYENATIYKIVQEPNIFDNQNGLK